MISSFSREGLSNAAKKSPWSDPSRSLKTTDPATVFAQAIAFWCSPSRPDWDGAFCEVMQQLLRNYNETA